ncbi:MAG: hypothetical protein GC181_14820 [Bacteroidetes bacterium]|nr:hypothetical protein [Bacteroidota bacterium]
MKFHLLSAFLVGWILISNSAVLLGQDCDKLNIQLTGSVESGCSDQVMTMTHDLVGRNFLYVANKESGLTIFNLSKSSPELVASVPVDSLDGLEVMGVSQYGSTLYLALGNFFSAKQNPGLAMIDVDNPIEPKIKGIWKFSQPTEGSSLVLVQGNYAFLAAFSHGVFILDISDPKNIQQVSQIIPALNFPDSKPDATKINARGMVLEKDVLYLCYDAGGIRVINISDKQSPKETGRYSNPVMTGKPRAYNNAAKYGKYLFAGVDYCGMEVLDVSDTSNIKQVSWWNPWNCEESALNWFSSNGHVNEVRYDTVESKLFMSTGKSDFIVLDVSDPANPDSCSGYGGVSNNIGTWGLNIFNDEIYLAYICTVVPFSSNWSGVKVLKYNRHVSISKTELNHFIIQNPVVPGTTIFFSDDEKFNIFLVNTNGQTVHQENAYRSFQIPEITDGCYFLKMENGTSFITRKIFICH